CAGHRREVETQLALQPPALVRGDRRDRLAIPVPSAPGATVRVVPDAPVLSLLVLGLDRPCNLSSACRNCPLEERRDGTRPFYMVGGRKLHVHPIRTTAGRRPHASRPARTLLSTATRVLGSQRTLSRPRREPKGWGGCLMRRIAMLTAILIVASAAAW